MFVRFVALLNKALSVHEALNEADNKGEEQEDKNVVDPDLVESVVREALQKKAGIGKPKAPKKPHKQQPKKRKLVGEPEKPRKRVRVNKPRKQVAVTRRSKRVQAKEASKKKKPTDSDMERFQGIGRN